MSNHEEVARQVTDQDRPISEKKISGLSNFFGIYGGEHIAATEFVIGATLVTWGCKASDILIGLLIGNLLATLTYAFVCAPIAVDTRLTLYAYLRKVLGPVLQKIYNLVWGIASIFMGAAMLTVSASAIREIFNVPIQTDWYPSSIKFVLIVIVLGIVVTVVAANGFEGISKFASVCAPWMIVMFLAGALASLLTLEEHSGIQVNSFSGLINLLNTSVWNGDTSYGQQLNIFHVIAFTWMCNLAYHGGLNDMAMFRYAKNYKYGFVSGYGMYIGHFFAWACAGIMGATAAIVLGQSLLDLDSGAITNVMLGTMGLLAVIVAGWTTANPNLYRACLSFQTIFGGKIKTITYIVGAIMTVAACFPATANILDIVNMIVLVVPQIGAMAIVEHWIIPKLGGTRFWSMYKGWKINYAALITWILSLIFVIVMYTTGTIHSYFLFIPTYLGSMVLYLILAMFMGAKGDYKKQEADELKVESALKIIVDEDAEKEMKVENEQNKSKPTPLLNVLQVSSYVFLIMLVVISVLRYLDKIPAEQFKLIGLIFTGCYFVLGAISTYMKYTKANA